MGTLPTRRSDWKRAHTTSAPKSLGSRPLPLEDKPVTAGLVVQSVTATESPVLYALFSPLVAVLHPLHLQTTLGLAPRFAPITSAIRGGDSSVLFCRILWRIQRWFPRVQLWELHRNRGELCSTGEIEGRVVSLTKSMGPPRTRRHGHVLGGWTCFHGLVGACLRSWVRISTSISSKLPGEVVRVGEDIHPYSGQPGITWRVCSCPNGWELVLSD